MKPLGNPNVFPSEEVIESLLGKNFRLWKSFFAMIGKDFPDLEQEWRYYRDGNLWLMKIQRKKKTVAWLSVEDSTFLTTFYIAARHSDLVEALSILEELKDQYRGNGKTTKGITVRYGKNADIETAKKLIALKVSIL